MVNVFGGSIASGPGNLQVVKKVVVTVSKFKAYIDEIQQSYVLDLHLIDYTRMQVVHLLPPFLFMMGKYMYWTMLPRRRLVIDTGTRGLKGDSGDKGPVGSRGSTEKRGVEGPEGPPGKIGNTGSVGSRGVIGARGEKGDKGDSGGFGQQGPIGP